MRMNSPLLRLLSLFAFFLEAGAEKQFAAAAPPAQPSTPAVPAAQADEAFTATLVGTWRVTWPENGWNSTRTFAADGTFVGSGSGHDEPRLGHWKIEGKEMIITYAEGTSDRWQLPLDPKGTTVFGKRNRKMTAVKEGPVAAASPNAVPPAAAPAPSPSAPPPGPKGAAIAAVPVADLLEAIRGATNAAAGTIVFDGPIGRGRHGAKGILLKAPPLAPNTGSTWVFQYSSRDGVYPLQIIHPMGGGQVLINLHKEGVGISLGGAWTELGYVKSKENLKLTDDAKGLFPLKYDSDYAVVSRLSAGGAYELLIDGRIVASGQAENAEPLSLQNPEAKTFPGCGRGELQFKGPDLPLMWSPGWAGLLLGPTDANAPHVCKGVQFYPNFVAIAQGAAAIVPAPAPTRPAAAAQAAKPPAAPPPALIPTSPPAGSAPPPATTSPQPSPAAPSASCPAAPSTASASVFTPSPKTTPSPPPPVLAMITKPSAPALNASDLVKANRANLVFVTTPDGAGSGFIANYGTATFLITNAHVAAGAKGAMFKTLDGTQVQIGSPAVAVGHDIFLMSLKAGGTPFEIMTGVDQEASIGDAVVVLGNAEGAGVINTIQGKIVGLGPNLVEVDAAFQPGNSGSPIIHLKTGKVVGVATYLTIRKFDSATKQPVKDPIIRRFGYRLDSIKSWQPVNWQSFYSQATEMEAVEKLTDDLVAFLQDLGKDGRVSRGIHMNPAIKNRVDQWVDTKSKHLSPRDAASADQSLLSFLKLTCQSDITAAQQHLTYDYFQRGLSDQQRDRKELAEVFSQIIDDLRK